MTKVWRLIVLPLMLGVAAAQSNPYPHVWMPGDPAPPDPGIPPNVIQQQEAQSAMRTKNEEDEAARQRSVEESRAVSFSVLKYTALYQEADSLLTCGIVTEGTHDAIQSAAMDQVRKYEPAAGEQRRDFLELVSNALAQNASDADIPCFSIPKQEVSTLRNFASGGTLPRGYIPPIGAESP